VAGFTISPKVGGTPAHNGSEVLFTPDAPLASDTSYTVQLLGVKDLAGNAMASPYTWSFRTRDTVPPGFVVSKPGSGALNVPVSVVVELYFNETMDLESLKSAVTLTGVPNLEIRWNGTKDFATVTPGSLLAEGRTYHLNVSTDATDLAGNRLAKKVELFFTTVAKPGDGPKNGTGGGGLLDQVIAYWPFILVAIIVLIILAAVIPSKRYLHDYYGVSEEDLKKNEAGSRRAEKQVNCEVCSLPLVRDDTVACKSCGRQSHVDCMRKLKKCAACKEPFAG
jgi:hypothetical protein